jgi:CRP-like cAMP-binding protein
LIAEEIKDNLSEDEYFMYLIRLKKFQEFDLLKKCLHLNSNIYPMKELDFEIWLKDKSDFIKNVPKNLNSLNLQFFLDREVSINSINFIRNLTSDQYIKNVKYEIDHTELIERKQVKVFKYKKILSMSQGQKFGDHALLPHVNHRTATVITSEDTVFAVLNKEEFNKCVAEVHEKSKQTTIQFFLNNPLFKGMEKNNFQRNYFNFFVLQKFIRGDFIFKEGDIGHHIYFLRKGQYEVSFFKSMVDLNRIVKTHDVVVPNEFVENEKMEENEQFREFMNEKVSIKVINKITR